VNAAKLSRVFAKPFVGNLYGHSDGVYCIARNLESLQLLASGAYDGEIRIWNCSSKTCNSSWKAHASCVRSVVFRDKTTLLSCGTDKLVQLWNLPDSVTGFQETPDQVKPLKTWISSNAVQVVDIIPHETNFCIATANEAQVYNTDRSEPTQKLSWGEDTINSLRINPVENHILALTAEDRTIALYDLRGNTPVKKFIMETKSSCIAWNPIEAFHFTFGCEDQNAYTFDMRNLSQALRVHQDHVSAILTIDYSPTGQEFVTGSYDKTVRIFPSTGPVSREVYYAKRMQRIHTVCFSADSTYIFCGSSDNNIRIWKTDASQNLRPQKAQEVQALNYQKALIERYIDLPEVKRIYNYRHVPAEIHFSRRTKAIMKKSQKQKQENRIRHSKPGSIPTESERKKHIVNNSIQ